MNFLNFLLAKYISFVNIRLGRLAQWESISFTPRGSWVQIPHRPPLTFIKELSRHRMVFNSYKFLFFFLIVYCLYVCIRKRSYQNLILLGASLAFYGFSGVKLLPLLLGYITASYALSLAIYRTKTRQLKKIFMVGGVLLNLGVLCVFKYLNFGIEAFSDIISCFGLQCNSYSLSIILPVGISFYTFQCLAYLVDIYRGDIKPEKNYINYALFISYFPQLVAGPIERASDMLHQYKNNRKITFEDIKTGFIMCCIGYFLKSVIADSVDPLVSYAFTYPDPIYATGMTTMLGILCFGLQIFGDFAGYSYIARGISRAMGIHLMSNFERPYLALNPQDFWRRWHISLSTWIRDYLYIPLGGSHCSATRTYINLLVTMSLAGLWHGASWNFLVWGFFHGALLCAYRLFNGIKSFKNLDLPPFIKRLGTFSLISFGWFLFRVESLEQFKAMSLNIVNHFQWDALTGYYAKIYLIFLSIIFLHHYWEETKKTTLAWIDGLKSYQYAFICFFLFLLVFSVGLNSREFIYFKF